MFCHKMSNRLTIPISVCHGQINMNLLQILVSYSNNRNVLLETKPSTKNAIQLVKNCKKYFTTSRKGVPGH